jgi:hypothetical protein
VVEINLGHLTEHKDWTERDTYDSPLRLLAITTEKDFERRGAALRPKHKRKPKDQDCATQANAHGTED